MCTMHLVIGVSSLLVNVVDAVPGSEIRESRTRVETSIKTIFTSQPWFPTIENYSSEVYIVVCNQSFAQSAFLPPTSIPDRVQPFTNSDPNNSHTAKSKQKRTTLQNGPKSTTCPPQTTAKTLVATTASISLPTLQAPGYSSHTPTSRCKNLFLASCETTTQHQESCTYPLQTSPTTYLLTILKQTSRQTTCSSVQILYVWESQYHRASQQSRRPGRM